MSDPCRTAPRLQPAARLGTRTAGLRSRSARGAADVGLPVLRHPAAAGRRSRSSWVTVQPLTDRAAAAKIPPRLPPITTGSSVGDSVGRVITAAYAAGS